MPGERHAHAPDVLADRASLRGAELPRQVDRVHADRGGDAGEGERRGEVVLDKTARALRPRTFARPVAFLSRAPAEDDDFGRQRLHDHRRHADRHGQFGVETVAELLHERRAHAEALAAEAGLAQPVDPRGVDVDGRQHRAAVVEVVRVLV
jgi:hypothetical protein